MDLPFLQTVLNFVIKHVWSLLVSAIAFWFTFVYLPKKPKRFPPGPTGLPVFGVALSIGKKPEETFHRWSKKYGDVIGFKIGNNYTVVLNSYEMIYEALVKRSGAFNHRPSNYIFNEALKKSGIFATGYSIDYMTQRNFIHGVLGKLGFGRTTLEVPILDEAECMIHQFGTGSVELNANTRRKFKCASVNTVAQLVFGKRYSDYNDPEFNIILAAWHTFFTTPTFKAALINPWLLHLPGVRQYSTALKNGMEKHLEVIRNIIKEHKQTLDESNPRDYIDEYLIEQKKSQTETLYTDTMLECSIRDIFGGGYESTELTLLFSCLLLCNRPQLMKKIHAEVDVELGANGKVRYGHREKMPMCHATLKEVSRFRTTGPLLTPHAVKQTVDFKGYKIPKGSTVLANVYSVHFDPKLWKNPDEFNPGRFIDEDGKVEAGPHLLPFGVGPRNCIGRRMAEMQVFIFFVTLFQRYDVIPIPKPGCERPWVCEEVESTNLGIIPPKHMPVLLVPRREEKIQA